MSLHEHETREILTVLETFIKKYNAKDVNGVLGLFAKDTTGFGTGSDEVITNNAQLVRQIRSDLDPANAIRLDVRVLATSGLMPCAWITALCTFGGSMGGKPVSMDGRMTAVLAHREGHWLFEQVHFSVPQQGIP